MFTLTYTAANKTLNIEKDGAWLFIKVSRQLNLTQGHDFNKGFYTPIPEDPKQIVRNSIQHSFMLKKLLRCSCYISKDRL